VSEYSQPTAAPAAWCNSKRLLKSMLCNTTQGLHWLTFLTCETQYSSGSRSLAYTYSMTKGKIKCKEHITLPVIVQE